VTFSGVTPRIASVGSTSSIFPKARLWGEALRMSLKIVGTLPKHNCFTSSLGTSLVSLKKLFPVIVKTTIKPNPWTWLPVMIKPFPSALKFQFIWSKFFQYIPSMATISTK
jgi:hypothetical protein